MKTALFVALMLATSVCAAPLYRATSGNVQVVLHSDKCALPEVTNLPKRAVWIEDGKQIEGCWGVSPFTYVVFYFADKTATAIPQSEFAKVEGA
jgi:hypothetical protein